jgi:hypothetical protein
MTTAHFIYIPVVVIVGIMIGFFLGGRAARDAIALEQKKEEARAAAKAKRAAAKDAGKDAPAKDAPPTSGS